MVGPSGGSQKTILFSGLKILTKKNPRDKKTWVYSWIAFCRTEMRVGKQAKNQVWEDSSLCPEISTKNAVPEFHLWTGIKNNFQLTRVFCSLWIGTSRMDGPSGGSQKTIIFSGFKNPHKKNPRNKKTWVYSWIAFCRTENEGRKPVKNSSLIRLELMPRNLY